MIGNAPRVYGIADRDALAGRSVPDAVEAMAVAGIRWIQVRQKAGSDRQLWCDVEVCCRRLEGADACLWIDDRVDIAAALPLFGVHLGQQDLPVDAARRVLGNRCRIGQSTHCLGEVKRAEGTDTDVVAVGPIFETSSKVGADPAIGLSLVRQAREVTRRPLLAIGGLTTENATEVLAAGADTVVFLGALCRAENIEKAAREIVVSMEAA